MTIQTGLLTILKIWSCKLLYLDLCCTFLWPVLLVHSFNHSMGVILSMKPSLISSQSALS